jgi:hypothetical protein
LVAYDVQKGHQVDFSLIAPAVRQAIIDRYHLESDAAGNPSFDSLDWVEKQLSAGTIPDLD